jgi:glycosyltransferase involved in cell wall biosynthesis
MGRLIEQGRALGASKANPSLNTKSKVAILLCTYNGQEFLQLQLDSFEAQTHTDWVLYVSDDGSTDSTLKIISDFAKKVGDDRVLVFKGPCKGFAANFLALIHHDEIEADYFSFADQDDVWLPKKLEVSLSWLKQQPESIPVLYCSRTVLIDAKGKVFGQSDLFSRPPSFANALVQSIGGGNTMVLNRAARNLVSAHSPEDGIVSHDWWVYILVSGNEGRIHYDPVGYVQYRQHGGNLVGMNGTWMARVKRAILLFRGRFRVWNDRHEALIKSNSGFLTKDNLILFSEFSKMRQLDFMRRVMGLKNSPLYRQTRLGNIGLIVGNAFKKV